MPRAIHSRKSPLSMPCLEIAIVGLSITSSWGNGPATIWRALCRAQAGRGHSVVFFERDMPYYASHRNLTELPGRHLYG